MLRNKIYRVAVNVLARAMRQTMRLTGIEGQFCIGSDISFYKYGNILLAYDFSKFGVTGDIDSGGNTERQTLETLCSMIDPGKVFYDIGAHGGLFSLTVKHFEPKAIVHAFEPLDEELRLNLKINEIQFPVHTVALGDKPDKLYMTTQKRSSNHITESNGAQTAEVSVVRLDDYIVANSIPAPDLIKLDIEGFEYKALKGAKNILSNSKPIIVTEINECIFRYENDLTEFFSYMDENGYELFYCDGPLIRHPKNFPLLPSADSNYWWIPKSNNKMSA